MIPFASYSVGKFLSITDGGIFFGRFHIDPEPRYKKKPPAVSLKMRYKEEKYPKLISNVL